METLQGRERSSCSGSTATGKLETIREAKASGRSCTGYRTWWDGSTNGPISNAWDIWKWPSTFILDADGAVIRFRGQAGKNGMIEAVAELLEEQQLREGVDVRGRLRVFGSTDPRGQGHPGPAD